MIYLKDECISYGDVSIQSQYSDLDSRSDVNVSTSAYNYPFIGSPMYHLNTKDMYEFFLENKMPFILHRYFPNAQDQLERIRDITNNLIYYNPKYLFVAVGSDEQWISKLILAGIKSFCVDMANGNSKQCIKAVKYIKEYCPDAVIMAGNIESYDGFKRLYDAGARYMRVGLGSGSICSTNINTGYGLPILTALDEINKSMSLHEKETAYLIADGGIRTAGDVAKALVFGASYVMCGKLFASTSKAKGPFFDKRHIQYKLFNEFLSKWIRSDGGEDNEPFFVEYAGMASKMMREIAGGSQKTKVSEEGHGGLVEYAGTTEHMFEQIILNLRAVLAYSGCRTIEEFKNNAIIRRVSAGGKFEKAIHLDRIYK